MRQLVLASTSPYRRQLLQRLQIPFIVAAPQTDETPVVKEPPDARALRLAEEKSRALTSQFPGALILGGDQTIAGVDGELFDKPGDAENAVRQIKRMRGKTLRFYTAVALTDGNDSNARLVSHTAQLRQLEDEEIENYVRKEPAFNCAGGIQIEGLGISLMHSIEGGDPTALIGMPLIEVVALLSKARLAKNDNDSDLST